jgi:hypothetical protein
MLYARALATVCLIAVTLSAHADNATPVAFPDNWFVLASDEAGLVFMLRSYGGDTGFDLVDETGRVVDELSLPKERTILAQYRVPAGSYVIRFFDREAKVKATPGFFAAFGGAVTHGPSTADGRPGNVVPDYAPFANYTPAAMQGRVTPLAELGTTDFLPPKRLDVTTLKLRLTDRN